MGLPKSVQSGTSSVPSSQASGPRAGVIGGIFDKDPESCNVRYGSEN